MGRAASYLRSERLEKVARINTDLRINVERREDLRGSMQRLHSMQYGDKVQKSGSIDHIADSFAKIQGIENNIIRETAELEEEKQHTLEEIRRLEKPEYVEVLYLRYVELMGWEKIADKMRYSDKHVLRLHKAALEEFARLDNVG